MYNVKINVMVSFQGISRVVAFNIASENVPMQIEYRNGNHYTMRD